MDSELLRKLKPSPSNIYYVTVIVLIAFLFFAVVRGGPVVMKLIDHSKTATIEKQQQTIGITEGSHVQFTLPNGSVIDGDIETIVTRTSNSVTFTIAQKQYTVPLDSLYITQ